MSLGGLAPRTSAGHIRAVLVFPRPFGPGPAHPHLRLSLRYAGPHAHILGPQFTHFTLGPGHPLAWPRLCVQCPHSH